MSPFLAQVQVINVAGQPETTAESPSTPAGKKPSAESIQAVAERVKTKALAKARQGLEEAEESLEESSSASQAHTVQHSRKSESNDAVFAAIPIVAISFTFLYLIVRAIMAPFTNRAKRAAQAPAMAGGLSDEEAAVLEKLQRTLAQMESRVESLETILIDQARTQQKYGSKL